jgi:hypothetical protein
MVLPSLFGVVTIIAALELAFIATAAATAEAIVGDKGRSVVGVGGGNDTALPKWLWSPSMVWIPPTNNDMVGGLEVSMIQLPSVSICRLVHNRRWTWLKVTSFVCYVSSLPATDMISSLSGHPHA